MRGAPWVGLAIAAVLPLGAAACDRSGTNDGAGGAAKNTVVAVGRGPIASWDPLLLESRQSLGLASRLFLRTLTAYRVQPESNQPAKLAGDLATSVGKASKDLKTWTFRIRPDAKWQDGSRVSCGDVTYGISRSFDDSIAGARPGYALSYLNIPKQPDGTSTYRGPSQVSRARTAPARKAAAAAARAFDKAVSCKGSTVTMRLSEAVADFPAVVSLAEFAPVKRPSATSAADSGAVAGDPLAAPLSSGPFQLQGRWDPATGGTWVRNPHWSAKSDPIRRPLVSTIKMELGQAAGDTVAALTTSEGAHSLSLDPIPADKQAHLGTAADTYAVRGQVIDYLALASANGAMKKPEVRRALALATNRAGYVGGMGGEAVAVSTWSLLAPNLAGSHPRQASIDGGPSGNRKAAQALLKAAGLPHPTLTFAYRDAPATRKGAAALIKGWEAAGFRIRPKLIIGEYFNTMSAEAKTRRYDIVWSNWGADYPGADTVLPLLFDSRSNLMGTSVGRDYGGFASNAINKAMDKAASTAAAARRAAAWRAVDEQLLEQGAYIALSQSRLLFASGRQLEGLSASAAYGGVLDLAQIKTRSTTAPPSSTAPKR